MYRSVMNLCVHCKNDTNFIKSIEDYVSAHKEEDIFKWVEEYIKEIGEHKVLQKVIDNATFNDCEKYDGIIKS